MPARSYDRALGILELHMPEPLRQQVRSRSTRPVCSKRQAKHAGNPTTSIALLCRAADLVASLAESSGRGWQSAGILSESLWDLARLLRKRGRENRRERDR